MMRIAFATFCSFVLCSACLAQQGYFICIQSDNNQPFYTRIAEKTYPSSAIGHLVIPGLKDSTYRVAIGFPRNKYPEQQFTIIFNQKDLGFQLQQGEGKVWALQNWQTQETIAPRAGQGSYDALIYGERKKEDNFATLMAAVVNDSAVLYSTIARSVPVHQEPVPVIASVDMKEPTAITTGKTSTDTPVIVQIDTTAVNQSITGADTVQKKMGPDSAVAIIPTEKPVVKPEPRQPAIVLLQEQTATDGKKLVFADSGTAGVDTISIVIAFEKDSTPPVVTKPVTVADSPVVNTPTDTGKTAGKTTDSPIVTTARPDTVVTKEIAGPTKKPDTNTTTTSQAKDPVIKQDSITDPTKNKLVLINSDCVNFATDYDVDKLRVKIMAETNIDGRLAAAKKVFKTKCFTTKQFKALSELFMNDSERYKFFELGYPFAADTRNYKQLAELLTDASYIARFKTMVRMQD